MASCKNSMMMIYQDALALTCIEPLLITQVPISISKFTNDDNRKHIQKIKSVGHSCQLRVTLRNLNRHYANKSWHA